MAGPSQPDPRARQILLNRSVAGHWDLFAAHRRRVTDLIASIVTGSHAVLCILGAGNCNDLDLPRLLERATEIHLVDVDAEAMNKGLERQAVTGASAIRLHEGDITGVLSTLARWSAGTARTNREIDECLFRLNDAPSLDVPPRSAHVAVSDGIISQLTGAVVGALGSDHPRSLEVALAIRDAHLRLLVDLLQPGGAGLVVTDLASTDTVERVDSTPDEALPELMDEIVRSSAGHTGTDPFGLESVLRQDPCVSIDPGIVRHDPWRWRFGASKVQLAYAISFSRT